MVQNLQAATCRVGLDGKQLAFVANYCKRKKKVVVYT